MMIVDAHCHVGGWLETSFSGRKTTLDAAVDVYGQTGIGGALVMPTDTADNASLLQEIMAESGDIVFQICAWSAPAQKENLAWLTDNQDAIAALKIHPSFTKLPATSEEYKPSLALAEQRGWPVLIHCGRWQEMSSYKFGIELARAHPELNVILCHMGGDSTDLVEATVDALTQTDSVPNVYLGTESIRQYWIVGHAIEKLGASRVIFGSDYNLNHPGSFLAVIDALDLTDEEFAAVAGGNINGLLPPDRRFF